MTQTHTRREKGQAVFFAALMVLSVFAMSAAFAGSAAAEATNVEVDSQEVDLAQDTTNEITVTHANNDEVAIAVVDSGGNTVTEDTQTGQSVENETTGTTTFSVNASSLDTGNYTVYAEAGATGSTDSANLGEGNSQAQGSFDVVNTSETYTLTVTANDEDETNIDDADVTVESEGETLENTTSDGSASFDLENGNYTVTVEQENYTSVEENVEINGADENLDVELSEYGVEQSTAFQGEEVTATVPDNASLELHSGDADDSSFVGQLSEENGEVTINTEDLEGDYVIQVNGETSESHEFVVAEQSLSAEFNPDSVVESDDSAESELVLDSNRINYDVEVSSEELNGDELADIFAGADNDTEDGTVILSSGDTGANFSEVAPGEYNFTVEATDTAVEADASIEVTEEGEESASFDSSTYSQTAGDTVEFTVDMENTDSTVVRLEEDGGNYWADLHVTADDGEDEVTVSFNTYEAGQNNSAAFSAENGSVDVLDERNLASGEYRLLPGDFGLELYIGDEADIDNQEAAPGDDEERLDLSGLEEVDVASLVLNERSIGDVTPGVAPDGAEITDADDIDNVTTEGSEVAMDDYQIVGVDIDGVFGQFDGEDLTAEDIENSEFFDVSIEHTNPEQYQSANTIDLSEVDVITDSENDRMFFVLDTTDNVEAGQNYDVTLTVNEGYYNMDNDEEASMSFSVVDREIEVTGDFDDEEVLQVENGEEASITGESAAAPGTDVQIRLRATGDNPFLMSQTAEVGEDGTIDAAFDLSEYETGQNFTVRMTDDNGAEAQDEVDAMLVESTDQQQPHPVTITVNDADGNAVSDATVEIDGETQTTDANGEATFELQHGEYDVTATYDGQEGSGTVTVGDNTSDTGTIVLGQEDQNVNPGEGNESEGEDPSQGEEPGEGDGDGSGDGDNTSDGNGSDGDSEDQPGFGIAVALIALLAAAGIAARKRA